MSVIKGTNQIVAGFGGTKRSIGEVYFSQSSLASDNSGALPLFTGETITSANTIYPEFYNWVLAHTELQCTSAEYESALSTYGECPKYVIGGGSLRLPKLSNYIKAANPSEGIKNIEAGLPDHYHKEFNTTFNNYGNTLTSVPDSFVAAAGIKRNTTDRDDYNLMVSAGDPATPNAGNTGNASASNPIYGKSFTVTPASTTLYPWVVAYTAAIPASEAQAAEFQQGLSGKADTNLGNTTPSQSFKEMSVGWGIPDYSAEVSLTLSTNNQSVITKGYIRASVEGISNTTRVLYINDISFGVGGSGAGNNFSSCFIPVDVGTTYRVNVASSINLTFYPCKGAN